MSDRVREAVSVFMDGEADELSVRRLVVQEDAELVRAGWSSYHRQRRVLQGADLRFEQMDISLSVMAALDAEPAYSQRDSQREPRAWLKPVAGLAVAASVAAIVVVGAPDWRQAGNATATTIAATSTENTTQTTSTQSLAATASV